jgi:hypothetical protein
MGNDLLIFAFRVPGETPSTPIFETTICSRTALAKENRDLEELGLGYAPTLPSLAKATRTRFLSIVLIVGILAAGAYMILRPRHAVFSDNH